MWAILEHMFDKFSQALTLMREAFADAQASAGALAGADLAAQVDGAQQVINAACAVQILRVAQYAARVTQRDASGAWVEVEHPLGHVGEFAADCFGPMLAMGAVAAGRKVDTAAVLASRLPVTLAAMSAGDLDCWRATVIATELAEASAQSCAAVEALIFPAVLGESAGPVTRRVRRVRRVVARVDADAVRVKAAKERLGRFVCAYPSKVPGLTCWVASLPAAESAACWAAIDDLAHRMRGDDPSRTLDQCRADALVDLMLTNVNVSTTLTLMIPVQTATVDEPDGSRERDLLAGSEWGSGAAWGANNDSAGTNDDRLGSSGGSRPRSQAGTGRIPCSLAQSDDFGQPAPDPNPLTEPTWAQVCAMGYLIPGIGVIAGDVVAAILDRFDTKIARVLLDEQTGVLIETGTNTYRPSAAMRRFVQYRDGHCRFPGCARGATRCEPDHIIAFSHGGPTAIGNLVSLCKHHHRVKHQGGWTLTMTPEGHCTWTDPHHRQYATNPTNHHHMAA